MKVARAAGVTHCRGRLDVAGGVRARHAVAAIGSGVSPAIARINSSRRRISGGRPGQRLSLDANRAHGRPGARPSVRYQADRVDDGDLEQSSSCPRCLLPFSLLCPSAARTLNNC